jgi:hypothetical protein
MRLCRLLRFRKTDSREPPVDSVGGVDESKALLLDSDGVLCPIRPMKFDAGVGLALRPFPTRDLDGTRFIVPLGVHVTIPPGLSPQLLTASHRNLRQDESDARGALPLDAGEA